MSPEHINALRAFQKECQDAMRALVDSVKTRDDASFTDGEKADFEQLDKWESDAKREADEGEATLKRIAELAEVPEATETGDDQSAPMINVRTDPFDMSERASSADLRSRAETIVEKHLPRDVPDHAREGATATLSKRSSDRFDADTVNEHIIRSSSPEYLQAFEDHIRSQARVTDPILMNRAAMSLTAGNGGVLVPQFLDPTIVLTNAGTENDIRQAASVTQITVDQWDGVTSAGVDAEWLGEGSEAADATPTFVAPTITAHKAAAYVFASYEVLADSGFDEVGVLFADAFDRLEETAFATGTGSSQPYGLVTQLSGTGPTVAGSSGDAGAADLVAADVYALDDALSARWQANASFVAHKSTYNVIRQLPRADQGAGSAAHSFWQDLGGGQPAELIGYPARRNAGFDSAIVSGSNDDVLLLGDLMQYKIVDRVGTSIMFNPLVVGSNQRPSGQAGWFAFKRVGADVLTSDAFKLLRI